MLYLYVAGIIVIADQTSKYLVRRFMYEGQSSPIVDGVLHLTLVHNKGAAFGILPGFSALFILATMVLLLLVALQARHLRRAGRLSKWGVTLAMSGACGNLIDRLSSGMVTDFIDVKVWPVFNLADVAIVTGTALIFWMLLRR